MNARDGFPVRDTIAHRLERVRHRLALIEAASAALQADLHMHMNADEIADAIQVTAADALGDLYWVEALDASVLSIRALDNDAREEAERGARLAGAR